MNLLIFSKEYFFNKFQLKCLTEKIILELKNLNISIYLIVQNHPCYNYKTIIYNEKGINIIKVQQYPFINFYNDNYYANNIRAQESAMLLIKKNIKFDYIIVDNIGYGLAAQSYSEIFGTPIIYLKYDIDLFEIEFSELNKWLVRRSNYVISEEQIYINNSNNLEKTTIMDMLNILNEFMNSNFTACKGQII